MSQHTAQHRHLLVAGFPDIGFIHLKQLFRACRNLSFLPWIFLFFPFVSRTKLGVEVGDRRLYGEFGEYSSSSELSADFVMELCFGENCVCESRSISSDCQFGTCSTSLEGGWVSGMSVPRELGPGREECVGGHAMAHLYLHYSLFHVLHFFLSTRYRCRCYRSRSRVQFPFKFFWHLSQTSKSQMQTSNKKGKSTRNHKRHKAIAGCGLMVESVHTHARKSHAKSTQSTKTRAQKHKEHKSRRTQNVYVCVAIQEKKELACFFHL